MARGRLSRIGGLVLRSALITEGVALRVRRGRQAQMLVARPGYLARCSRIARILGRELMDHRKKGLLLIVGIGIFEGGRRARRRWRDRDHSSVSPEPGADPRPPSAAGP